MGNGGVTIFTIGNTPQKSFISTMSTLIQQLESTDMVRKKALVLSDLLQSALNVVSAGYVG